MNRVVHFEIHAKNGELLQKFYEDAFGWKMQQMGPDMGNYIVVTTGGMSEPEKPETWGINGGITPREGSVPMEGQPVNAFVCIIGVNNIDEAIEKVKAGNGMIALDKMDVPTVGKLAYAKDPEGNLFGMLEPDPTMANAQEGR